MGLSDFASWLFGAALGPEETYDVTDRHRRLADGARGDSLTADLLAEPADRTSEPVAAYLDDGEQPHYLFRGARLLVEDAEESLERKHPTRQLVVLVSDERLLFVLGGHLADEIFEVPLSAVTTVYVDDEDYPHRHVVVEADRDGDEMTFFADVTIDPNPEAVAEGVEYVRSRR